VDHFPSGEWITFRAARPQTVAFVKFDRKIA
jgi:hypothetical protein